MKAFLLISLLCFCENFGLAQTKVATLGAASTTASSQTTNTWSSSSGQYVVGIVKHFSATLNSVTTASGTTCTIGISKTDVSAIGVLDSFICGPLSSGSGTDSVTATLSSSSLVFDVAAIVYSGVAAASAVDVTAASTYNFNTSPFNPVASLSYTTTLANEVMVGCVALENIRTSAEIGVGSGWTLQANDSNNLSNGSYIWCEDKVVTSIQSSITASFPSAIDRFMLFATTLKSSSSGTSPAKIWRKAIVQK